MSDPFADALILTGPTASGKSVLALELAERLGGEIVSMDSMTLYRGLDVGTAKPTPEERRRVRHHLIDVLEPWESASVAWWLQKAAEACRDVVARGRRPLLVGGTGLYLKAVLCGLFDGPPADEAVRRRLFAEAEAAGAAALHARLGGVDPVSADRLHPNDVRRVVRALEVWELTGRRLSEWQTQWSGAACGLAGLRRPALWLDLPREDLYRRINARVEAMVAAGLLDEVRRLRELPRPLSRVASQALGYKEVFAHLDGRASLEETVRLIQTRSRQFAKRQVTWFRHLPGLRAVGPAPTRQLTIAAWGLTMDD